MVHNSWRRHAKILPLVALALSGLMLLTGCSWQSLSMSVKVKPAATTSATPKSAAASPKVTPSATPATSPASLDAGAATVLAPLVRGALASGSATHKLTAGTRTLVITYWTTQDVGSWTSAMSVPIQVSAHMEDADTGHAVEVTQFKATLTVDASPNVTTMVDDNGQFVITPPYSYGSVLTLPAEPSSARTATISIEFDLLVETYPKSGQFFRQTVLDSLPITYVAQSQGASND